MNMSHFPKVLVGGKNDVSIFPQVILEGKMIHPVFPKKSTWGKNDSSIFPQVTGNERVGILSLCKRPGGISVRSTNASWNGKELEQGMRKIMLALNLSAPDSKCTVMP